MVANIQTPVHVPIYCKVFLNSLCDDFLITHQEILNAESVKTVDDHEQTHVAEFHEENYCERDFLLINARVSFQVVTKMHEELGDKLVE